MGGGEREEEGRSEVGEEGRRRERRVRMGRRREGGWLGGGREECNWRESGRELWKNLMNKLKIKGSEVSS